MDVNVNGIRFIADTIELHADLYRQHLFGDSQDNPEIAGTGVSCGSPCCVAGFVVQFLGNNEDFCNDYFRINLSSECTWKVWDYARDLLSLPYSWSCVIFEKSVWPSYWFDPEYKGRFYNKNYNVCYKHPDAKEAVFFLRRLADQFESDMNKERKENEHKEQVVEFEYA